MPPRASLECLWIARYLPYPLDAGAKVYSARLAASLAAAGAHVRFLGYGDQDAAQRADAAVDWKAVPGSRLHPVFASLSRLPVAAAIDATGDYRRLLQHELRQRWDAIVFDGYGTGWALPHCRARRESSGRPVLVHVSHNHETKLWADMAAAADAPPLKRMVLRHNARRIRALEHKLLAAADLVTAITDEDRLIFAAGRAGRLTVTLNPGFTGSVARARTISAATPRRVLLMGSFTWVVKQENLIRFLAASDALLHDAGITLDVIGDVPADLLARLTPRCRATRFHGFVMDAAPFLREARLAVVPEMIGGGFKLKFLDYFFGRVPVATIRSAAAGLPAALRAATLQSDDLEALARTVVAHIDDYELLNHMQNRAFEQGCRTFDWGDRGRVLKARIEELCNPGICPEPVPTWRAEVIS